MPFISTSTNVKITNAQEISLKEKLGKAIELIPGKSETWLMLSFQAEQSLWFKGTNEPAAYVEVKSFGSAPDSAYDKLTKAVTALVAEELGVNPARIYVKYEEISHWGWNGSNF